LTLDAIAPEAQHLKFALLMAAAKCFAVAFSTAATQ
jgi:hypothetical protein